VSALRKSFSECRLPLQIELRNRRNYWKGICLIASLPTDITYAPPPCRDLREAFREERRCHSSVERNLLVS
jgi:hypothetical protein